jgi:hypothetical protein
MPVDRPTARELIETVAEHLAVNVRPQLSGHASFEAVIATNLLAIALRELELEAELAELDREQLTSLLGQDASLGELERQLAFSIREGELDDRAGEVKAILRASAGRRLRISNPGYVRTEA